MASMRIHKRVGSYGDLLLQQRQLCLQEAANASASASVQKPPETAVFGSQVPINNNREPLSSSSSSSLFCLCAPTSHAGSFRCRFHRSCSTNTNNDLNHSPPGMLLSQTSDILKNSMPPFPASVPAPAAPPHFHSFAMEDLNLRSSRLPPKKEPLFIATKASVFHVHEC